MTTKRQSSPVTASTNRNRERWSRHARVLLAEDDGDYRNLVAMALMNEGLDVYTATDGDELHVLLSVAPPDFFDLVVTDLRMPGLSGMDGLALHAQHVPFVILSAHVEDRQSRSAGSYEPRDVMAKSSPLREVCQRVVAAMGA